MRYLKIVLSIIAVLLTLHLIKEYIPVPLQAGSVVQVEVVKINGRPIFGGSVPVEID